MSRPREGRLFQPSGNLTVAEKNACTQFRLLRFTSRQRVLRLEHRTKCFTYTDERYWRFLVPEETDNTREDPTHVFACPKASVRTPERSP